MDEIGRILNNSEIWLTVASIFVVVISIKPLIRFIHKWAQKEVLNVQDSLKKATDIRIKAADLLAEYQVKIENQSKLRQQVMAEADAEIALFQTDIQQRTDDIILHKKQEMALRLKMITENSQQDIKNKMLNRILKKTEKELIERRKKSEIVEDMDTVVNNVCLFLKEKIPN